jgi:hypothetical protein
MRDSKVKRAVLICPMYGFAISPGMLGDGA